MAAPFGNLDEDGTRFKIAGSGGGYSYRSGALPDENKGRSFSSEVIPDKGAGAYATIMFYAPF